MAHKNKKLTEYEIQQESTRLIFTGVEIYRKFPKLHKVLDYVDFIRDENIATLAVSPIYDIKTKELTGNYEMYWNPSFTNTLDDTQLLGVQIHEILHILLNHTTKRGPEYSTHIYDSTGHKLIKEKEDKLKSISWNLATDCAINQLIKSYLTDNTGNKLGVWPEQFKLPLNKNAEYYYKNILNQAKENQEKIDEFIKELEKIWKNGKIGEHDTWIDSNDNNIVIQPNSGTPKEITNKENSKSIQERIEQISKELGLDKMKLTADSSNITTDTIKLDAGKQKKTPGWMKKTTHSSVHGFNMVKIGTRKVPNRRYGLSFPGIRRQQLGNKVLVAVDISGSIEMHLYKMFTEHLNNMQRFADFDIIFFNYSVLRKDGSIINIENPGKLDKFKKNMSVKINGGTNFEPVVLLWNKLNKNYDSLFVFTDGCASYNTTPIRKNDINWIIYNIRDLVDHQIQHGNKYYMNIYSGDGLYEDN